MGEGQSKKSKNQDKYSQFFEASFEMRQHSKSLEREAIKSLKNCDLQKAKAKAFLDKGDLASA